MQTELRRGKGKVLRNGTRGIMFTPNLEGRNGKDKSFSEAWFKWTQVLSKGVLKKRSHPFFVYKAPKKKPVSSGEMSKKNTTTCSNSGPEKQRHPKTLAPHRRNKKANLGWQTKTLLETKRWRDICAE